MSEPGTGTFIYFALYFMFHPRFFFSGTHLCTVRTSSYAPVNVYFEGTFDSANTLKCMTPC